MASSKHKKSRVADLLVLGVILAIALLARLIYLDTIPANLMLDEADNTQDAYMILLGRGKGPAGLDWSQAPLLSMYILAGCIRAVGNSIAGIRSMPVLLSLLTLIPFYVIARRQLSLFASAAAAVLLSTALWYLHFSRTAWINMTAPLFALGAAYFLGRAVERGRWRDYLCCAAFTTLGVYGYPAGLSIPITVAAALPFALAFHPERWRTTLAGFACVMALTAVLFVPHLQHARHAEGGRMGSVSILDQQEYLGETNLVMIVAQQIGRNLAGFVLLDPGQMGRGLWAHYLPPGRTVIDHGTGVLFWLGMVVGLVRWRATYVWWLFFLVPVLTVQVFSKSTPDAGRALIVAPFMYLFVALGIESLLSLRARVPSLLIYSALAVAVVWLAATNVREYFTWIESAQALTERQPAVALHEFRAWSRLQRHDLASGGRGFGVMDWRARIDENGCKNGTLKGGVCSHTSLLPDDDDSGVQNRAFTGTSVREDPPVDAAIAPPRDPGNTSGRPAVRHSTGATVSERDQARRRDLARLAQALDEWRAREKPYPTTKGKVQSVCYYGDDAACILDLHPIPADPRVGGLDGGYWYRSDGKSYALFAVLEGSASRTERCRERPDHIKIPGDVICIERP